MELDDERIQFGFVMSAFGPQPGGGSDIRSPGTAGDGWRPPEQGNIPPAPPAIAGWQEGHRLVGVARDVRLDVEQLPYRDPHPEKVLSFRIERYDEGGNRLAPVQLQMRGAGFEGTVGEGDWVGVAAAGQAGKTLIVDAVENLTTQTTVMVRRARAPVWFVVIFVLVLAVVLMIFAAVVSSMLNPPDPPF